MKLLSRYIEALRLGAAVDQKTPVIGDFAPIPPYMVVRDGMRGISAASWANSHTLALSDTVSGTYQIVAVSLTFGGASSSGTVQVEVCNGTTALASGTNQLTAAMSASGTINTPVSGTLITSPTVIQPGGRINMIWAGTNTGLGTAELVVVLKRVS